MSAQKRTENWKGITFAYEGRQIVKARFKHGYPQTWVEIPAEHYGSRTDCLDFKNEHRKSTRDNPTITFTGTFGDFFPIWLEEDQSIDEATRESYRWRLNSKHVRPLHAHKLRSIRRSHITARIQAMRKAGLAPSTIEGYLTPVSKAFTWAKTEKEGHFYGDNPVSFASLANHAGEKEDTIIHPYTDEQMALLLDSANDQYRNLFALTYYVGGRASEMLGLRWGDFVLAGEDDSKVIFKGQLRQDGVWVNKLKHKKRGEVRVVDLPSEVWLERPDNRLPFLSAQKARCWSVGEQTGEDDYVFPDITYSALQDYISGYERRGKHYPGLRETLGREFDGSNGAKPFTMHLLRHTYGSWLIRATGGRVDYVSQMMGDTIATVEKYYYHDLRNVRRDPAQSAARLHNRRIWTPRAA